MFLSTASRTVDGAETANQAQAVAVADQEAQVVSHLGRAKVVGPPIQSAAGGHGTAQVGHGETDDKDAAAGDKPRPDHASGAGGQRKGEGAGDGRQEAHDGEGDAKDLESGEVALQLLLVAHLGQELGVGLAGQHHAAIARGHDVWMGRRTGCRDGWFCRVFARGRHFGLSMAPLAGSRARGEGAWCSAVDAQ